MKKLVIIAVVAVAALAGVAFYSGMFGGNDAANAQAPGGGFGGGGGFAGGGRGGGGGRFGGGPMTVEVGTVHQAEMSQQLVVVGNLIGDATVSVVPRTAGRLQDVFVRLGDSVSMGQRIAKIEDQEIVEQVRQAEAAFEVSRATIRQREADLALALTNVERSRNLFQRQLLPKQTLDDNEARYQAAVAQLDLARAQNTQSQARLDELKINLGNTSIVSPVDGFVARRAADPGAFVSQNAPVVDVVDIRRVRLIVNVVEKDLRQVQDGDSAAVNVDAFPGETFTGRIARVAPVLDPSTRTAPIEIEIPNPGYRLKPGMYARVNITTDDRRQALVVPNNAVVDLNGRRGVFLATDEGRASFRAVRVGIEDEANAEILEGVAEGDRVITTGSAALTDGAAFVIAGQAGGENGAAAAGGDGRNGGRAGNDGNGGGGRRGGRRGGQAPAGN
ncbi:MAG: efflux RND transporter periplasmic adaptor subunit [Vicinamibacterales bacterium]